MAFQFTSSLHLPFGAEEEPPSPSLRSLPLPKIPLPLPPSENKRWLACSGEREKEEGGWVEGREDVLLRGVGGGKMRYCFTSGGDGKNEVEARRRWERVDHQLLSRRRGGMGKEPSSEMPPECARRPILGAWEINALHGRR